MSNFCQDRGASDRFWKITEACGQAQLSHYYLSRYLLYEYSYLAFIITLWCHLDAVLHILHYIKGSPGQGQGVLYEDKGNTQFVGYTNVD